jgi:hypothetical protein
MPTTQSSLLNQLTFSRTSTRTNSDTGAEIASGVAFAPTMDEIVPTGISAVAGSDGYYYVGRLSDGRYVFNGSGGIYTSTNGEPPYTLLVASASVSRITPSDTFLLLTGTEPGAVYRRPAPYTTQTLVHTMQRGFAVVNGVSGTATNASAAMNYAAHGNTIILGEYSNAEGIKDDPINPPRYLHRSTDDGATWSVIDPVAPEAYTHVHALFYDDVTGNWYLSYGDSPSSVIGVYKSTDAGLNWTHVGGPTIATEYGVIIQPVSALRFGNYIVWGTDSSPTGLWVHDTTTDTFTRSRADYSDTGIIPTVTWTGVAYNLAKVDPYLLVLPAQGHENYHKVYVTDDLQRFWKLIDMDTAYVGFSQPVVRADGSFLIRPSQLSAENFVKIDGLTLRRHATIATDEAVNALAESTAPLDGTFWSYAVGEYIGTTGPGGMRAYKIGDFRRSGAAAAVAVNAGDTVELSAWVRNPLSISVSASLIYEVQALDSGNGSLDLQQKGVTADRFIPGEWRQFTFRITMPANTVKVGTRVFLSGVTYNASTTYLEIAGLSVTTTPAAGTESHDRAAESATVDKSVGAAWGVYDRVFPRWDTYELTANKTLLTLTDVDTSAYLSVGYNATSKAFTITDGFTTETGAAVRCMGSGSTVLMRSANTQRIHYGRPDFLAYGVRRTSGVVELIVWDKVNRTIAATAAPGSFAPSNLRIAFPASGVLHVPSFASDEMTDAQTFSALQGIEEVLPQPPSELRVIPGTWIVVRQDAVIPPGGWPVIVPDIIRVW